MELFRICKADFATNLTASGTESRWNKKGQQVIYAGSSRSLSTLELIVRRASIQPTLPYKVMVIHVTDNDDLVRQVNTNRLPVDWQHPNAYPALQEIGSNWYTSRESLLLKVPSAIIPLEYNFVINTQHPDFSSKVQLVDAEDYFWDERLL